MTHIRMGKRPGPLSRDAQQQFEHERKQITKDRINRLDIGMDKRLRQMHKTDIDLGRAPKPGENFQYYTDTCIADGCLNRKTPRGQPVSVKCYNKKCKRKSLFKVTKKIQYTGSNGKEIIALLKKAQVTTIRGRETGGVLELADLTSGYIVKPGNWIIIDSNTFTIKSNI